MCPDLDGLLRVSEHGCEVPSAAHELDLSHLGLLRNLPALEGGVRATNAQDLQLSVDGLVTPRDGALVLVRHLPFGQEPSPIRLLLRVEIVKVEHYLLGPVRRGRKAPLL